MAVAHDDIGPGLLAERSEESILVLEAGPDFGALFRRRLAKGRAGRDRPSESHQRDYGSDDGYRGRRVEFPRASMIGGCSSHNGCAAIWGSALDYDALAARGFEGWSRAEVEPLLAGAHSRDGYAELNRIHEELDQANALQRRLGCPVLDVSNLAVEEAAVRVIELVEARTA